MALKIYIPVKIISTEDSETINKIIKATNWQTQVPKEAFETTRDFHKNLEEFFMVMNRENDKKIYYERRSKQYNNTSIHNHDIVTMPILLKCYMSMYMYLPHATHQYYGQMLIEHRKNLFSERHKTLPYYASAYLFKLINERLWRNNSDRYFRDLKFNYLHLLGVIFFGEKGLDVATNDAEKRVSKMLLTLKEQNNFMRAYNFRVMTSTEEILCTI